MKTNPVFVLGGHINGLGLVRSFSKKTDIDVKEMWDYLRDYFDKKIDMARMLKLPVAFEENKQKYREALIINGNIGTKKFYVTQNFLGLGHLKELIFNPSKFYSEFNHPF